MRMSTTWCKCRERSSAPCIRSTKSQIHSLARPNESPTTVWYWQLNLGFKIPAGAGTDATANYAAPIRGMVGMDRVYVWVPAWPLNLQIWMSGLRHGRTFATNGPLVNFTLGKEIVGSE